MRARSGRSRPTVASRGSIRRPTSRASSAPAASTRARWRSAVAACGRSAPRRTAPRRSGRSIPEAATVVRKIEVPADGLDAIVFGAGSLWGTDGTGGRVWRIDVGQPAMRPTHADGGGGAGGQRDRVRAARRLGDQPARRHRVAHRPGDQSRDPRHPRAGGPRATSRSGKAGRGSRSRAPATARPRRRRHSRVASRACAARTAARSSFPATRPPDALVVSDLPLQGAARADALTMSQAIALTLKRHGFPRRPLERRLSGLRRRDRGRQRLRHAALPAQRARLRRRAACRRHPRTVRQPLRRHAARRGQSRPRRTARHGQPERHLPRLHPSGGRERSRAIPASARRAGSAASRASWRPTTPMAPPPPCSPTTSACVASSSSTTASNTAAGSRRSSGAPPAALHLGLAGHATWNGGRPAARPAAPRPASASRRRLHQRAGRSTPTAAGWYARCAGRSAATSILIGIDGLKPVGLLRQAAPAAPRTACTW